VAVTEHRPLRRAIAFAAVLFVLHLAGTRALDALGVADRLLASGGSSPGTALPLVALLAVRLLLFFAAPAVVVGTLVYALARRAPRADIR
jgi:hypothetical protein